MNRKYIPFDIFPTRCNITQLNIFLEKCSTCFGWYLHSSSGAHTTVFTVSGTCQTVTATCPLLWKSWNWFECGVGIVLICFGAAAAAEINKLCNVASCWKYIKRKSLFVTYCCIHDYFNIQKIVKCSTLNTG